MQVLLAFLVLAFGALAGVVSVALLIWLYIVATFIHYGREAAGRVLRGLRAVRS